MLGSLYERGQGALGRASLARGTVAVTRAELGRLAGLFVPAAIFVAAIPILGMYLASAGYVFAVLALPKRQSVLHALVIAVVTPVAVCVGFERLFQVSLPLGRPAARRAGCRALQLPPGKAPARVPRRTCCRCGRRVRISPGR